MNRAKKQNISTKDAVDNIIKHSQKNSNLLEKYNAIFFIHYFDKNTIQQLEDRFKLNDKFSKERFVKQLTCFIFHRPDETLYLVMSLINIFNKIINQIKSNNLITLKDFTYYLCKSIVNSNERLVICNKEICVDKINPNSKVIRSIDVNSAVIISHPNQEAPKISKEIKKIEKKVHDFKPIHYFYFCNERKQIITLARLASEIKIYNLNLKEVSTIHPNCFKIYDKNMVILSMCFSEKYQRIGCIIANLGMAFWDYQDNFQTQKLIKKVIGDKIDYLCLLDEWITIDSNKIYFWDLKYEKIKDSFQQPKAKNINDIKEITHLRCFIVSYTFHDENKWLYVYKNENYKIASKLKIGTVGAQKIHYNRITQTIMLVGLNQLPIYQIDNNSFDLNLITHLYGHQSIITAISDLDQGLIMTGDDRGIMRIWDLKILRCQQVIKVAKSITEIECVNNLVLFSDTRINIMRIQQLTRKIPLKEQYGIKKFYKLSNSIYELFIFTITSCRIYDLTTGKTKKIVQICIQEEQILYVQQIHEDFLISTTKGYLFCYSEDLTRKWKMNMAKYHEEEITFIKADNKNNFFTTISKGGYINVWNLKTMFQQGPRKSIINKEDEQLQIDCFDLSERYSMIVTSQQSNKVMIWDYEFCKLCHVIQIQAQVCSLKISHEFPLLIIGCQNEKIYLYKVQRNDNLFKVQLLNATNLRYPENNLNSLLSLRTFIDLRQPDTKDKEDLFKKLYCNNILFFHQKNVHMVILSYGRGNIIVFNLSKMVELLKNAQFHKLTSNIQRPVKEVIEKSLNTNHYRVTVFNEASNNDVLPVVWNKKVHKDTITDMDNFQHNYISTLAIDGYLKIICVQKYETIAKLNIRYPLPTIWNYRPFQFQQFGKKIYEALALLSDIINDKDISITKQELQILSINEFLDKICSRKLSPSNKKHSSVHILKDELSPQDLKNVRVLQEENSLKYLQAFKRVNLSKECQQERPFQYTSNKRHGILKQQKEFYRKLLSPDYLPALYGRPDDETIDKEFNALLHIKTKQHFSNTKDKDVNHVSFINDYKCKKAFNNNSQLTFKRQPSNVSLSENNKSIGEESRQYLPQKKLNIEQIRKKLEIYNTRNKMPAKNIKTLRKMNHTSLHEVTSIDIKVDRPNKRFSVLQESKESMKEARQEMVKLSAFFVKQRKQKLLKKVHKENRFFMKNM